MKSHRLGGPKSPRHEVRLHRKAEDEFLGLPAPIQDRFEAAIDRLEEDPRRKRPGVDVSKLRGTDLYRLRVGPYRAIYAIDENGRVVIVLVFDERETGYARLIPMAEARRRAPALE